MVVELKGIEKGYGAPGEDVLRGISLGVEEKVTLAIQGPSGSGKSTLLNIMGALDLPDKGEVFFRGEGVHQMDSKKRAYFRNRNLGFIFQMHHLLPQCTVLENVLLPALPGMKNRKQTDVIRRGEELLERVGLADHRHKFPPQLSGGERQRAAAVRAMINKPALILADEPTGSLDRDNALGLVELLIELNRDEGAALVIATHSDLMAEKMGKRLLLVEGRLEESL